MNVLDNPLPRPCVVVPTYNNGATIGEVIRQVRQFITDIVVVNDGSTDGTAKVLAEFGQTIVVTHHRNHGKGKAIASGFKQAIKMGFTHAIAFDADGQHLASDLPKFLEIINSQPDALIVGTRDLTGKWRPLKSRVLRTNSNFWTWLETGRWLADTQSGYRAYPLHKIAKLKQKCYKYDFEVEILIRAIWVGIPVVEVPVSVEYGPGSESHFRPVRDFALVFHLNCCLLMQRFFLPGPLRLPLQFHSSHRDSFSGHIWNTIWQCICQGSETPGRFASSIGLGVMFGILPIWGFQIIAAAIVAHSLKLNKPLTVAASNVSFPAMIPLILYVSLMTGRLILTGNSENLAEQTSFTSTTAWSYPAEYLIGSVFLAVFAGLGAFVIFLILSRVARPFLRKRQP